MSRSELHSLKDKKVNDKNWSCLVVLLIEANQNSMSGIDLFEKHVRSSKRTDIQNLTPNDLESLPLKEKGTPKDVSSLEFTKSAQSPETFDSEMYASMLHALLIKKYILEYKVNDLSKRAETIRYLLNNEIIVPDSDSSIPEPDYGAFCYFILTRFYNPFLINNLLEIEIPLVAVLEFRVDAEQKKKSINPLLFEETKQRQETIDNFWPEFMEQLNNPHNQDFFSEFLFLPIEISSEQWNDKKKGDVILENILLKLLTINDLMRKYIHYINNVEIIDAPTTPMEGQMDIYNNLLGSIPLECVTIELILHCVVEQVVAYFVEEVDENEPCLENFESVFEKKEVKFPLLFINHRDKIRQMTFNLKTNNQLNLNVISSKMHSLMTYASIWNDYPPQTEVEKALNANKIKKLLTCATEVIAEDKFITLLHLMSFNKLLFIANNSHSSKIHKWMYDQQLLSFINILRVDKEKNSKMMKDDKTYSELAPNTLPKRLKHLNSLKSFLECHEFDSLISYEFQDQLNYLCYTEHLPRETLLQILNEAYSNFLHYDNYYCPFTDKLLIWFHNFCDENGLHSQIQEGLLNAKIGFGDFYTYPDNETDEWLSNQKKYITLVDDALKKSYLSRNFPDINPLSFVLNPSIKVKIPFPKKEYMDKKSGKVPFAKVYNSFGSSRIKVSEQTDIFFSIDGPSLTSKKTKWLRKDGFITIILNSHNHLLTLHQSLLNLNAPPVYNPDQDIFFNIESNKGILVSSRLKIKKKDSFLFRESETENVPFYETLITLPNGLVVELFRGRYNFIKQTFLDKNHLEDNNLRQEDHRIFLNNGTIIVFMNDGSILILYSNSTEARIKIVGKKPPKNQNGEAKEQQRSKNYFQYNISEEDEEMAYEIIRHDIVGWNGKFLRFNKDEIILSKQLYELRAAFCSTRGLFTARSDGTKCYVDSDGILTISFPDKTITTVIPTIETLDHNDTNLQSSVYVENEDEDSFEIISNKYIMDHPYYMKVEFISEQWVVHLPFGGQVTATTEGFELAFDEYMNIDFYDEIISVYSRNRLHQDKETITNIFLKGEVPFEYNICSVQCSDGKVFKVSNTGATSLTSVRQIAALQREGSSKTLQEFQSGPKRKKSRESFIKRRSTMPLSSSPRKNYPLYATKHFKNQILVYTKTDVKTGKKSDVNMARSITKFCNTKHCQRFFVLNRDLSGYEFINEYDIQSTLKKYKVNFKVFQPFLPCTTVTNDITVCQLPIRKTWNQLFWTPCCNSRLYNTNLKKNELLSIPKHQTWLCISTIVIPNKKIEFTNNYEMMTDDIGLEHPAMLIRRIKSIKTKFKTFTMFKLAVKQFNKLNCEIMHKFEKRLLPTKKLQSDIDKTEMIFKNAMEELMQSKITHPFTALMKGDSMSTIGSSETSLKIDESEESDETDSQRNHSSSLSDSTNK